MYWGPTVLRSFAALLSLFRLSYCLKFCSKEDNRVTGKYENIMSSVHKNFLTFHTREQSNFFSYKVFTINAVDTDQQHSSTYFLTLSPYS